MASDGKVIICTELDNSGIEKGIEKISGQLNGLEKTLKSIAGTVVKAFTFDKIKDFAIESSEAARTMSDALKGLQSILEGQGRSFSAAQSFIEEYTKDGLIPATNAITAYKDLASRGYDDSQIRQVMLALKDASAYGRQASYTMGEAVESATEGLKNENSILVDNAGVTKNVAKMWEEYAASIGTTANNLTQQQKIQAEVTGILAESKYQAGDAATVAGTLSGQLQQLSFNFNNLKVAIGNAINPIIQTFLPIINTTITAVTRFANAIASVVGALFGKASVQTSTLSDSNDSVASSASAGAKAEEKLADATTAAGKAAKKSLAGFDELNVLQSNAGSGGSSAGISGAGASSSTSIAVDAEVDDELSPKLQAVVEIVREVIGAFGQLAGLVTGKISFGEFIESLTPLQSALLSIVAALSAAAVAVLGMSAFNKISTFIKSVVAGEVAGTIGKIVKEFQLANNTSKTLSQAMQAVFGTVATTIAGVATVVGGAVLAVTNFFSMLSNGFNWLNEALMIVGITIAAVGAIILGAPAAVAGVVAAIVAGIGTAVALVVTYWDEIVSAVRTGWENLKEWFSGLVDYLTATFADGFVNGILTLAIDVINRLISIFTDFINWIASNWDALWSNLWGFFSGSTFVGGEVVSNTVPYSAYAEVPALAKGAVLPANKPFLAMVGDQTHGTNVEAPLDTIKQAVAEVLAGQGGGETAELLRELIAVVESIEVGDDVIGKAAARYNRRTARARGI